MTVISPELPASRAGSLPLIADDLALDFANTESGRGFPSHQNHFREAGHVVEWLRHAKALRAVGGRLAANPCVRARGSCRGSPGASDRASRGDTRYWRGARASRQAARSGARQSFRSPCAICRRGRACARNHVVPVALERSRFAGRSRLGSDRARRASACSRKAIFTASENARVTLAAGCSMIAARTTAGGGAKWRSAAIAPSSGDWRRGGAGLEPSPGHSPNRSYGRRNARRLLAGAGD